MSLPPSTGTLLFDRIVIIGAGLIGSSLARAIRPLRLTRSLTLADADARVIKTATRLHLADECTVDLQAAVMDADLVILATPVGSFTDIVQTIASHLKAGTILTDVGSVKHSVAAAVVPLLPPQVAYVPGHPIAGTEFSGPEAGFAELFRGRWCVLTPLPETPLPAVARVQELWEAIGAIVTVMTPEHHDRVLALTSHLPTLIAFSAVNTAADLGEHIQSEVLQFSAGGFRGFTRLAAQDPVMWRDIFLANRDAVLEQLHLLQEDLAALTRAIRWGDAAMLEERFARARAIRRGLND